MDAHLVGQRHVESIPIRPTLRQALAPAELRLLNGLFAVAFVAALVLAWLPVDWTIGRFVYDDMFYYLRVAEHLASGAGSTFDGSSPTNGYHPMWMLVCTGFACFLSGDALVHAVLTVAAVLHAAQGIVLSRILVTIFGVRLPVVWGIVGLYLLNWRTLAVNLCGLETALATLAAMLVFERLLVRPASAAPGRGLLTGMLLGFAALCRFDLLMLCTFAGLWTILDPRHPAVSLQQRVRLAAAVAAGMLLMLLPWFVFSWNTSGSLLPNSRHAVKFLSGLHYDTSSLAAVCEQLYRQLWSFLWWSSDLANLLGVFPFVAPTGKGMMVAGFALICLAAGTTAGLAAFRKQPRARLAMLVVVYCAMHFGYYAVFHRVETRYVLPPIALFLVPIGVLSELTLSRYPGRGRLLAGAGALAFACALFTGAIAVSRGHASVRAHKHHYVALDMARWLKDERPTAVVGAWNAGVLSYFSRTELVNLDGVINDPALAAIAEGRLGDYIRRRGITLLVDEPGQMESNLKAFGGLQDGRPLLGPVVHTAQDAEGRRIVAREVLR